MLIRTFGTAGSSPAVGANLLKESIMNTLVLFDIEETLIDNVFSGKTMPTIPAIKDRIKGISKRHDNVTFGIFSFAFTTVEEFDIKEGLESILDLKLHDNALFFLENADKALRINGLFFTRSEITSVVGKPFSLVKMVESSIITGFDRVILFDDSVENAIFRTGYKTIEFIKV